MYLIARRLERRNRLNKRQLLAGHSRYDRSAIHNLMGARYIVKAELLAGRESASLTQHSIWILLGHGIIDADTAIRPIAIEQWHTVSDYFNIHEIPAKIREATPNRELALKSAYRTSLYPLFRNELSWQGEPARFLADDNKLVLYRREQV